MIFRSKVLESRALTPSAHMIRVERAAGFDYRPVQFCGLELATGEGIQEYPMSLASSPTQEFLEFGARLSASPWKRAFAALRPGDEVEIDGAYGHFVLDESRDALFVAGGIGITPLKGMSQYLSDVRSPHRAVLVYSNRSQEEIAYRGELEALAKAHPRLEVIHTLTREPAGSSWSGRRGRVDAELLREGAARLREPTYYLCGKGSMVREVGSLLREFEIPSDRISFEVFPGYQ